ncbi:MAG: SRPBCC family protein [Actinomycetota bacterium]|nr:SRPBCC family protein [Actinomycetota bacterium]
MTTQTQIKPVRKTISVQAPPDKAFAVFTEGIATWWPLATHSVGAERQDVHADTVVFETRAGGRLFERLSDGREVDWGEVVVWEPPNRIVLTWHPGYEDPSLATEIEVRFDAVRGGTRLELEHRGWERLRQRAQRARESYDSGWDTTLSRYVEAFSA